MAMLFFFVNISVVLYYLMKYIKWPYREPDPGPFPYMEIDHEIVRSFFSLPLVQEGLLPVRNEYSVCSRSTGKGLGPACPGKNCCLVN